MAISDYFKTLQTGSAPPPVAGGQTGAQQVQSTLNTFMDPNSDYIQNARRRGIEYAATRGLGNSSIAAGAAERSALEAAAPLAQQANAIDQNRENVQMENWLAQQGFNRELAMIPIAGTANILQMMTEYGAQDPELYTPEVVSGFSNFFTQNMGDVFSRYFGGGTG